MIIDAREPKKIQIDLEDELGEDVPAQYLKTGDYSWDCPSGKILMERKSVNDLLNSMKNGRISEQLRRLIDECDLPILLIEGAIGQHYDGSVNTGKWKGGKGWQSQWSFSAVDDALLSWQLAGIFLAHSPRQSHTAHRIVTLHNWSQRAEHYSLGKRKIIDIKTDSPQVTTLATLPGLGHKRAREIVKKYSLKDLVDMEKPELIKVLGKVTGDKVYGYFNSRNTER